MKNHLLIFMLMFASAISAQTATFKDYNWNEKNTTTEIPTRYAGENEVILSRVTKVEIAVEGSNVRQYYLLHEKTWINSDEAIERNNKIYIPFNLNEQVLTNKVRVILKNGNVINLNKSDIKEEIDEAKNMKYNFFAVNGLEKGAVIEKLFILEEFPQLKGKTFTMQSNYPIADLDFSLIYPKHLEFKTKAYNGLTTLSADTTAFSGKVVVKIAEKDIPALHNDEQYSNWAKHLKRFRYKLDANTATGARNMSNYKEFATNLFERMNPIFDKKQLKVVSDFAKDIPLGASPQEQIWNIENKIKTTIVYSRYFDAKESLAEVIKSKQASQTDLLKLYIAVLNHFNMEHNIVITSDRYSLPFDNTFESYENLDDVLLYFPQLDFYLTPTEIEYRTPLFPPELANTYGLFIKPKMFGGVKMGIGEINFIAVPNASVTHDVMDITVDFTKDIENPEIRNRIAFGGFSAMNFQPLKDFVSSEQYQTMLKSVAENFTSQTEFTSFKSENDGTAFVGKKPFVLDVVFSGKDLIQKADGNYLFSVGQTIGRQTELYHETQRMLPVEISHPHSYLRTIKILLPSGIAVSNLEKLVMDIKMQIGGKTEAGFTSNYTTKADEITIVNTEFYNIAEYPLNDFEKYRQVINAAADFNKLVIILK